MGLRSKKQVVIVNDIKSDSIEQAIFILRDKNGIANVVPNNGDIVLEAERIINSFLSTGICSTRSIHEKQKSNMWVKSILYITSSMAVVGISLLILSFFG